MRHRIEHRAKRALGVTGRIGETGSRDDGARARFGAHACSRETVKKSTRVLRASARCSSSRSPLLPFEGCDDLGEHALPQPGIREHSVEDRREARVVEVGSEQV
ncbi:MAG: hypothetical protein WDM88_10325 [Galbitalea sp.]